VFVVQLAALSDYSKAQALKERAVKAGFPAYTDALGSMTRVRVGPYMSRDAAENAAAKLAANGLGRGQVLVK
jgi:DedD protein